MKKIIFSAMIIATFSVLPFSGAAAVDAPVIELYNADSNGYGVDSSNPRYVQYYFTSPNGSRGDHFLTIKTGMDGRKEYLDNNFRVIGLIEAGGTAFKAYNYVGTSNVTSVERVMSGVPNFTVTGRFATPTPTEQAVVRMTTVKVYDSEPADFLGKNVTVMAEISYDPAAGGNSVTIKDPRTNGSVAAAAPLNVSILSIEAWSYKDGNVVYGRQAGADKGKLSESYYSIATGALTLSRMIFSDSSGKILGSAENVPGSGTITLRGSSGTVSGTLSGGGLTLDDLRDAEISASGNDLVAVVYTNAGRTEALETRLNTSTGSVSQYDLSISPDYLLRGPHSASGERTMESASGQAGAYTIKLTGTTSAAPIIINGAVYGDLLNGATLIRDGNAVILEPLKDKERSLSPSSQRRRYIIEKETVSIEILTAGQEYTQHKIFEADGVTLKDNYKVNNMTGDMSWLDSNDNVVLRYEQKDGVRNYYDAEGRLVARQDAVGASLHERFEYETDPETGQSMARVTLYNSTIALVRDGGNISFSAASPHGQVERVFYNSSGGEIASIKYSQNTASQVAWVEGGPASVEATGTQTGLWVKTTKARLDAGQWGTDKDGNIIFIDGMGDETGARATGYLISGTDKTVKAMVKFVAGPGYTGYEVYKSGTDAPQRFVTADIGGSEKTMAVNKEVSDAIQSGGFSRVTTSTTTLDIVKYANSDKTEKVQYVIQESGAYNKMNVYIGNRYDAYEIYVYSSATGAPVKNNYLYDKETGRWAWGSGMGIIQDNRAFEEFKKLRFSDMNVAAAVKEVTVRKAANYVNSANSDLDGKLGIAAAQAEEKKASSYSSIVTGSESYNEKMNKLQ